MGSNGVMMSRVVEILERVRLGLGVVSSSHFSRASSLSSQVRSDVDGSIDSSGRSGVVWTCRVVPEMKLATKSWR